MMRTVEYYRLWADHTWDTDFIDIPVETEEYVYDNAVRAAANVIDWGDESPVDVG